MVDATVAVLRERMRDVESYRIYMAAVLSGCSCAIETDISVADKIVRAALKAERDFREGS